MIKFVHCADIHIGMENYGRLNPATGLSTRLEDFLGTLDEAVDRAIADEVDLFVVAGDIYKTKEPTPTHQREFARRMARVAAAGIQIMMIAGNHDLPLTPSRATAIDIFSAMSMPNVNVARTIRALRIETRGGPVQILALPWMTRSITMNDPKYKHMNIHELNRVMIDMSLDRLRKLRDTLDPSVPTMIVAHAHVHGAKIGAERLLTVGHDPMLAVSDFPVEDVGYVALGHIHRHQALVRFDPAIVYPGSINRVDFAEEIEDKGFIRGDLQCGSCDWQFVNVNARPFLTITAFVDDNAPLESVLSAIRMRQDQVPGAVVQVKMAVSRASSLQVPDDAIRDALNSAYVAGPIHRIWTDQEIRERSAGVQGSTPGELLQEFLVRQNRHDVARQAELMSYAESLMERLEVRA